MTYTDGTKSNYTQGVSDWAAPNTYPGGTTVTHAINRVSPNGQANALPVNIYALTAGKKPVSLALPTTTQTVVFGVGIKYPQEELS